MLFTKQACCYSDQNKNNEIGAACCISLVVDEMVGRPEGNTSLERARTMGSGVRIPFKA